jgi:hypothetical protein
MVWNESSNVCGEKSERTEAEAPPKIEAGPQTLSTAASNQPLAGSDCDGECPEYHTSADDLNYVSPTHIADSLGTLLEVIDLLEGDVKFLNLSPMGASVGEEGTSAGDKRERARANGSPVAPQSVRRQQLSSRYC